MAVELEMPESAEVGQSNFLNAAGTFHVIVTDVSESPTKDDGTMIQNAKFSADLEVLAGEHKGKMKRIVFFAPDPPKKGSTGYELDCRKPRRFLEATGVVAERVPGGTGYTVDVTQAISRQLVIAFSFDTREGKEKLLQIHYADIFHIDDPDPKAKCDRCQKSIAMIPASLRRKPESFAKEKSNGNDTGGTTAPKRETVPASSVDLDDL